MAGKPEWIGPKGSGMTFRIDPRWVAIAVVGVIVLFWMLFAGPTYTVAPEEQGILLTFGRYTATTPSGLHFKLPWPIQTVETPKVTQVKRLEIGFRSTEHGGQTQYQNFSDMDRGGASLLHEAQMLTGDQNVVNCSMSVQYRITDPVKYLFNFTSERDAETCIHQIGQAALRQAIGDRPIDHALTSHKEQIQTEVMTKMQELVDLYGVGVRISNVQLQDVKPPKEVEQAFREVASAREKREEIVNQARGYQNEQLPRAQGEARRITLEAEAYKESRLADARGQASRFTAIAKQYEASPEVTRSRMYLETMEKLLPRVKLTVVDPSVGLLNVRNMSEAETAAAAKKIPETSGLPRPQTGGQR